MKKRTILTIFSLLIIIFSVYSQSSGDGFNDITLSSYGNEVVVARHSITILPGFTTAGHSNFHAYIDPDLPLNGGEPVTDGQFNLNFIRIYKPIKNNATQEIPVHMGPVHHGLDYNKWAEITTYYDGLGRPIQQVQTKLSPGGADVVKPIIYDEFGRVKKEYLSYAITQDGYKGPGGYRPDPVSEVAEYYASFQPGEGNYAFAEKQFDNSPLNRVLKQGAPGMAWNLIDGKTVNYSYLTNQANEVALFVTNKGVLSKNGFYNERTLFKNTVTDENGALSIEYKDKSGKVVLKVADAVNLNLKTYYVYDDFGLLRFVIPPKASQVLESQSGTIGSVNNNNTLSGLCFYYKYDSRKRMTVKKIPGKEAEYIIYNKRDQIVLTQDGNLRVDKKWNFTKYDVFNRPVITGVYFNSSITNPNAMQDLVTSHTPLFEQVNLNTQYGYTNDAFPTDGYEIYTVTYYDNYQYIEKEAFNHRYDFRGDELPFEYPKTENVKGRVTATLTKVFPNGGIEGVDFKEELIAVNYYDKYYHLMQTVADDQEGILNINSSLYNFTGQVLQTTEHRLADGVSMDELTIHQTFDYDRAGRLLGTLHQINNNPAIYLNVNKYTELGLLSKKWLHADREGNYLQKIDYKYNIRDWMTDINNISSLRSDAFALKLNYTTGTHPQFNGNISEMKSAYNGLDATYDYEYDGANRLLTADYNKGYGEFSTGYEYDNNGNITTINRKGSVGGTEFGDIDNIALTYNGNQLMSANDLSDPNHQNYGFVDNHSYGNKEYKYDPNGNMVYDFNKKLIEVKYNYFNLPTRLILIREGDFDQIFYQYDAAGNKLCKQATKSGMVVNTTRYFPTFETENKRLKHIFTAEGKAVPMKKGFEYQYFIKDHLGNTRVVLNQSGKTLQQNGYYPFGMLMAGLPQPEEANTNKYLYNGKELQDDFGLDWYDYGARFYDAEVGRFHTVDNKAEKYFGITQFAFALNNPILFIDPDGNDIVIYYKEKGQDRSYRFNGSTTKNTPNNKFVSQVIKAWNYNVSNGGGSPSFEAATNNKISINIVESNMFSVSSEGSVFWNPNIGTKSNNGIVMSPASILDHELDHQVDFSKTPVKNRDRALQKNKQYGTNEEERVITGSEQETAKANGEIKDGQTTRTDHGGHAVVTNGVTSNKINRQATYEFYKYISKETPYDVNKYLKMYEKK